MIPSWFFFYSGTKAGLGLFRDVWKRVDLNFWIVHEYVQLFPLWLWTLWSNLARIPWSTCIRDYCHGKSEQSARDNFSRTRREEKIEEEKVLTLSYDKSTSSITARTFLRSYFLWRSINDKSTYFSERWSVLWTLCTPSISPYRVQLSIHVWQIEGGANWFPMQACIGRTDTAKDGTDSRKEDTFFLFLYARASKYDDLNQAGERSRYGAGRHTGKGLDLQTR